MKRAVIVAATLFVAGFFCFVMAWYTSARAEAREGCYASALIKAAAASGGYKVLEPLSAQETKRAVDVFHAMPPKDDTPFDLVMLLEKPDGSGIVGFGFVEDDSMCARLVLTDEEFPRFKRAILDRRA